MDSLAATLRGIAKDPAVQDQAQQAGRSLAHGMIDGIKGIFTGEGGEETVNFLDLIYGLGNSIMDAIRGVWDIITTIGAEFAVGIMIGIAEFITGKKAKDDLGDSLVSVLESILKLPLWVLYGQEWAGALWQSFKDAIGSMSLSGLGNLGGLLSFQSGGMVPGPIGAPTLAMVHGGEMVLNPQQQSVVNNYFNQTVNTRAEQSSVIQDFNMLKSLAGVA